MDAVSFFLNAFIQALQVLDQQSHHLAVNLSHGGGGEKKGKGVKCFIWGGGDRNEWSRLCGAVQAGKESKHYRGGKSRSGGKCFDQGTLSRPQLSPCKLHNCVSPPPLINWTVFFVRNNRKTLGRIRTLSQACYSLNRALIDL